MAKHVMIDIETLDTESTAVVVSVGVAFFNEAGVDSSHLFIIPILPQLIQARTLSHDTLSCWRENKIPHPTGGVRYDNMPDTLGDLLDCISDGQKVNPMLVVWANGTTFDITILENLLTQFGYDEMPWKFWNIRDFRTMKSCLPCDYIKPETTHDAKQDACDQVNHLLEILKQNNLNLE